VHNGAIEIASFEFGRTQAGTITRGESSDRVVMQDTYFILWTDKSSPKPMVAYAGGDHIPEAVLTRRKAGKDQQEYLKVIRRTSRSPATRPGAATAVARYVRSA